MMWRCIDVTNSATEVPAKSATFAPFTSTNVSGQFEIKCVVLVTALPSSHCKNKTFFVNTHRGDL